MCTVCGCGQGETRIGAGPHDHHHEHQHPHQHDHEHVAPDGTVYRHSHGSAGAQHHHARDDAHDHAHHHHAHTHHAAHAEAHARAHAGALRLDRGPAGTEVPGMSQARLVRIEEDILAKNDEFAAANRLTFAGLGVFAVNLVSSPGAGKTTLLVRTLTDLAGDLPAAVIEGDQQTDMDASRIRATGVPALQVNTGKGCHLDAQMVTRALGALGLPRNGLLFVENVGNLVCPAGFDLGEAHKAVVVSVTEGEDKPLKYPNMFAAAGLMLVNKIDLLPHLQFDVARLIDNALKINPGLEVLQVSATTGEGLDGWYGWLRAGLAARRAAAPEPQPA
jgi:hydrogenase nickel incorporation protein HypB